MGPAVFEIHPVLGSRQLSVTGELDVASRDRLSEAVEAFLRTSPGDLALDLSGVTFLDAAGLGRLVVLRQAQLSAGHELGLVGSSATVVRLFALTGLQHLLADATRGTYAGTAP